MKYAIALMLSLVLSASTFGKCADNQKELLKDKVTVGNTNWSYDRALVQCNQDWEEATAEAESKCQKISKNAMLQPDPAKEECDRSNCHYIGSPLHRWSCAKTLYVSCCE